MSKGLRTMDCLKREMLILLVFMRIGKIPKRDGREFVARFDGDVPGPEDKPSPGI